MKASGPREESNICKKPRLVKLYFDLPWKNTIPLEYKRVDDIPKKMLTLPNSDSTGKTRPSLVVVNSLPRNPETHPTLTGSQYDITMFSVRGALRHTRQAPMATAPRLTTVRAIFRHELPYCFQFRNNQNMPLMPSGHRVSSASSLLSPDGIQATHR